MQGRNPSTDPSLRRREFLLASLLTGPMIWSRGAWAQPRKSLVGSLNSGGAVADTSPFGALLLKGLVQRGYTLGGNLELLRRGADLQYDKLPGLISEFATTKTDVVVCFGYAPARAMKDVSTLPVVSFTAGDPVGTG